HAQPRLRCPCSRRVSRIAAALTANGLCPLLTPSPAASLPVDHGATVQGPRANPRRPCHTSYRKKLLNYCCITAPRQLQFWHDQPSRGTETKGGIARRTHPPSFPIPPLPTHSHTHHVLP